jgi:CRP/FNR family transcriptional regulator, cyclic AMP receptor protein
VQTPLVPRWVRRIFRNEQHAEALAFFRGIPIFHGLTARQLGRVMLSMQRRQYRAGESLFEEGQVGKAVFVIKNGQVELTRETPSGRRVLGTLGAGQMFGEMALLEQMQRTASATVIEDGEIFLLYTATLDALIRHHPAVGVKLLRNMAIMLSALLRKTNKELDRRLKAPHE